MRVLLPILAALLATGAAPPIKSYSIPSESMEPTIRRGDVIFTAPIEPPIRRGEVIVFLRPDRAVTHVSRVAGLAGDSIEMKGGLLLVNGAALMRVAEGQGRRELCWTGRAPILYRETNPEGRNYLTYDCGPSDLDDMEKTVVPAGHLFVMGDHRDNSLDSRVSLDGGGPGAIPLERVLGIARTLVPSPERQKTDPRLLIPIE